MPIATVAPGTWNGAVPAIVITAGSPYPDDGLLWCAECGTIIWSSNTSCFGCYTARRRPDVGAKCLDGVARLVDKIVRQSSRRWGVDAVNISGDGNTVYLLPRWRGFSAPRDRELESEYRTLASSVVDGLRKTGWRVIDEVESLEPLEPINPIEPETFVEPETFEEAV